MPTAHTQSRYELRSPKPEVRLRTSLTREHDGPRTLQCLFISRTVMKSLVQARVPNGGHQTVTQSLPSWRPPSSDTRHTWTGKATCRLWVLSIRASKGGLVYEQTLEQRK